jgi:hypothetical protein
MEELSTYAERWYTGNNCPFIRAAFLDVVSICGMTMLRRPESVQITLAWEILTSAVSIGPDYALGVSSAPGDALLMQSLVQIFFIDRVILRDNSLGVMVSKEYQGIGDAMMLLTTQDEDNCCAALNTLDAILKLGLSNGLTIPLDLVLAHVHRVVLHATDPEVISTAQAVLADGLTNSSLRASFFPLVTPSHALVTLTRLESQCLTAPPSNTQSAIHLLGHYLDFAYTSLPLQRRTILPAIARYIRLLRSTIVDTNTFDTRFAAAQSLNALEHIWRADPSAKSTSPIVLGLALVLHTLLADDDDEIRDRAAVATAKLLRREPVVPVLSAHRLGTYLSSTFGASPDLVREATRRLTTPGTPFVDALIHARKEDAALFATEKQNLYFDETLDAVFWSRILINLSCPLPASTSSDITAWTLDALAVLTATARSEIDGALGWASKPDVFALGIRVLCAAEVVIREPQVLVAVRRFADACEEREGHGLWGERMERLLERGVVLTIRGARRGLEGVMSGL